MRSAPRKDRRQHDDAQGEQQEDSDVIHQADAPLDVERPHSHQDACDDHQYGKVLETEELAGDRLQRTGALDQHDRRPAHELHDVEDGDDVGAISPEREPAGDQGRAPPLKPDDAHNS